MALINLQTNKPKLNVSNIRSPFGGGASIPKISAGAGSLFQNPGVRVKPGKVLNIDEGQLSFNVGLADDIANLRKDIAVNRSNIGDHEKRISMLSGGVSTLNEELSEITAIIKDIGDALSLDFANRITEQQQDNRALRAQISADKRSSAESNLEGKKKIGKGIGSGITGLASKTGSALGLGKILEAGKLLAAGIAINALWPQIENIFDWSMKNLDKILLVGGGLLALNVIGGIGTLLKFAKFFRLPQVLAAMAVLYAGYQIGKPIFKARTDADESKRDKLIEEGVDSGKTEQLIQGGRIKDAGGSGSINNMKDIYNNPLGLRNNDVLGTGMGRYHDGGIVTGTTQEVPAILERGEAVLTKEQIALISKKPGINFIEIDLPDIRVPSNKAAKKVALPEATQVPYASSVNSANKHMTKTPEIHGIIG